MSLKAKLEAVIYAAEEPVTLAQLAVLFATDAIEWKAEQQASSEAEDLESANVPLPVSETLPLIAEELGPEIAGLSPEDGTENADAEAVPEAATDPEAEADAEAEAAPSDADEKRLARQRDREARAIIRTLLDELIADYAVDGRGVEIREIAGGFRMATKPECHDAVRSFVKSLKPALKLSLPALETLAVVAYKQPVTAPEVNEIRGVDSSGVFGSLLARKLIATAGRKQVIGRPILYKTTREFLLRFGLKDVNELPSMEEFEKMASLELDEPEPASREESDAATTMDLNLELDANEEEESVLNFTPATTPTAETAASNEHPLSEEAAPAAPPATEQAETENFPHGEEVKEER